MFHVEHLGIFVLWDILTLHKDTIWIQTVLYLSVGHRHHGIDRRGVKSHEDQDQK